MTGALLAGRRAVVTGAAQGLGPAIAQALAAEGAVVAMLDINAAVLETPAARLGGPHRALVVDVGDEQAVAAAMADVARAFGGLDLVVANAAIEPLAEDACAHLLDLAVWQRVVQVNLTGTFLTCKHGLAHLLAHGGGAVVCVASPTGQYGIAPQETAYSASKAGVLGLVRSTAAAYAARGIRINAVVPGLLDTRVNQPFLDDPDLRAGVLTGVALGRPGEAREVAQVAAFLASDRASYVTGAVWAADGGLTAI